MKYFKDSTQDTIKDGIYVKLVYIMEYGFVMVNHQLVNYSYMMFRISSLKSQ